MLGRDKNRVSVKQTSKIRETIPASQVRQQIRHGTSLLGGPYTTQYSNAQQYPTQQYPMQQSTTQPLNTQLLMNQPVGTQQGYSGYTADPYLNNMPMQQQLMNNGSKVETKIKTKTKIKEKIRTSNVDQGLEQMNMVPVQGSTSAYGASMPMGTNVMQRKRSSSSSSSSSSDRNRMKNTGGMINTSNVETLGQTQPYPQNTYTTQLPFQSGNIQTGYGTTQVGYQNPMMNPVNPIESTLYRSSTQRKGPILGKNLYGQTGFASTGYSIQQPFPGQNVYIEEDPAKISQTTKSKFERSIM